MEKRPLAFEKGRVEMLKKFLLTAFGLKKLSGRFVMTAALIFVAVMSNAISTANATAVSTQTKAEIEALLNRLGSSTCQFNRNGTWYSAAEAKAHLAKKFDYVLEKNLATTTEQLIDAAAAKSSVSGKPYQVRCPNAAAQDSAAWLNAALKDIRAKN